MDQYTLLVSVFVIGSFAENNESNTKHKQIINYSMNEDTTYVKDKKQKNKQDEINKEKPRRWAFFPIIGREKETSWVFGVLGIHFF